MKKPVQLDGPGSEQGRRMRFLGSHPDTCNVAATRGAVVAVHMMEILRAHDGRRLAGGACPVNFRLVWAEKTEWPGYGRERLHFGSVVNNFTYCGSLRGQS